MSERVKPPAIPNHLPQQFTPFVGRRQELTEITRLLSEPACRLLTLLGPGGVGKTRLAVQSGAALQEKFTDGLGFVPLQPLQSTDLLISAIADTLNLHLSGQQDPQLQLFNYLQDKEMLLLLDNFEHLVEGAGLLMDLLRAAPAVKLLVTSREALNLPAEWLFPLEGLPYPAGTLPDDLEAYSAIQLFAGCARRIRPDFSVADEGEGVARICRLVEGTPLALELAASWVNILNCTEIAAEIQRNLDFLTNRWRDIPSRHQSMKAVFNHSYTLLEPKEQAIFKRLAVFRGGFRRQAAEQVAGASLLTLSALVDKSLLHWEANGRYQIHELLRQYAAEQLVQSEEDVAQVYDDHGRYYTEFLGERIEALRGGRQREALAEIEAELENIRAAWQWAVEQLKIEQIQKSVESLGVFYDFRGRYLEGVKTFEPAIQRLGNEENTRQIALTVALLSVNLGGLYIRLGRLEAAEAAMDQCQALYHQLGIPPLPGLATDPALGLSIIASIRGDYAEAARLSREAYQTAEAQNHHLNRQIACYLQGRAALLQGQYTMAQQHIQQAYALTQETGDRWFMAYCLNELGQVAITLGHYETAREHYTASFNIRKEFDDPEGMAVALSHLGEIVFRQENYAEAQQLYQQSLVIAQEIGNLGVAATALRGLGQIALALTDYPAAQHHFRQALQLAAGIQFVPLILSLFVEIGELLLQSGLTERGLDLLNLASHHPASEHETQQRARQLINRRRQGKLSQELFDPVNPAGVSANLFDIAAEVQTELVTLFVAGEARNKKNEASSLPHTPASVLVEPLTERELDVLRLIAAGLTNREIAERLSVVIGTVKAHANNIYGKLGVNNRVQALARARELNLL